MADKSCVYCSIVLDVLTGIDGKSFDIARVSWVLTMLVITIGEIWNVAEGNHHFDTKEYAEGIAIMAAAHGAAIFAKKETEPKLKEEHHAD
jgi:hypothetical protein